MPFSVLTGHLAAAGFREGCLHRQKRSAQPDKGLRDETCSVERHWRPTKNAMKIQEDSAASSVRWLPRCLFTQTIPLLGDPGKSLQAGRQSRAALERVVAPGNDVKIGKMYRSCGQYQGLRKL